MAIFITNEQGDFPVKEEEITKKMSRVLAWKNCDLDLSIALVNNRKIRQLHREFLGKDTITDVLSFPLNDGDDDPLLGEVVVSVEKAVQEAVERGISQEREVLLYMIHGFLHLIGYDDKDSERATEMHREEDRLLSLLGWEE